MIMNSRKHNDVLILLPEGKITLGDGDQELGEAVRTALANGSRKIVINFSKVSYLDSSGVGELVGCYTTATHRGAKLKLMSLPPKISDVLTVTQLITVFDVFTNEKDALASF